MTNLSTNNSQLGYYLAGLIEGDGNIWTSKTFKSPCGRIRNPRIGFTFHKNEEPLYTHLKGVLDTGGINQEKLSNVCKYSISEKNKLIKTINLINGKFRTPKIRFLHRAIDRINLIHKTNIEKLPLDISNISDNAWLAGMTDAEGNFYIYLGGSYSLNNLMTNGIVKCSFSINQRIIDKSTGLSCVPFMTKIADLFQYKIYYKTKNAIVFIANVNNKHYLVKSYFDKFPLMSSKYLNYLSYLDGLNYLNKRLTNEEIISIQAIKNSMNDKRTYFNWDHLDYFYK